MSDNIPFEIQVEIIKRVAPVRSLVRFRSVSKQWKSLIDSSKFIAQHHILVNQTQPHHLLVKYELDSENKYVSFVDDDSFPNYKLYHTLPPVFQQFKRPSVIGCSHGLVCLDFYIKSKPWWKSMVVLWNPSARKYLGLKLPNANSDFGFGVCRKTGDPKIVKISMDRKAEVFSLSSRAWRSVPLCNLPRWAVQFNEQVVVDGVIYWSPFGVAGCLISFDLTSEEFGKIELPESLRGYNSSGISKLGECLVMFCYSRSATWKRECDAWMMLKDGASKFSFTKFFTFDVQASHGSEWDKIVGFRKNGQLIMERKLFNVVDEHETFGEPYARIVGYREDGEPITELSKESVLQVCDQQGSAESSIGFGIRGSDFWITSYVESLLLLKDTNSIIDY